MPFHAGIFVMCSNFFAWSAAMIGQRTIRGATSPRLPREPSARVGVVEHYANPWVASTSPCLMVQPVSASRARRAFDWVTSLSLRTIEATLRGPLGRLGWHWGPPPNVVVKEDPSPVALQEET